MTATNKQLLIYESRGDSNRCTPYRGKLDQHVTHFPRSVRVWSRTIRISSGPHIATFHIVINRVEQGHCSWEKGLLTQSTARWLTDSRVCTQFLSRANQWSNGGKAKHLLTAATRLTGPWTPACGRYIQYLLTGANPSVLNRCRQGLLEVPTYHIPLPDLPNRRSSLST
jgi:hypothetical protein